MLRFPNRVAQSGVFYDDTVDYVALSSGAALAGMRTFATAATADGWDDNDLVGILITKADGSYKVWTGQWSSSAGTIVSYEEEATSGTFSNSDAVEVRAVATKEMLRLATTTPEVGQFIAVTGTSYTAGNAAAGKVIRCTSSSTVTVTLDSAADVGVQFLVVREGSGAVNIQRDSSDTVNGTTSVSISSQWKSAYCYQHTEATWTALV